MSELVDRLLDDLHDRKGYHLTDEIRGWLRDAWQPMIDEEFAALKRGLRVLGGSPKDMLEYCQENGLLPKTGPDGLWEGHVRLPLQYSTDDGWRKLIVDSLLEEANHKKDTAKEVKEFHWKVFYWNGKPITEYTKDELVEIVEQLGTMYTAEVKKATKYLKHVDLVSLLKDKT